MTTTFTKNLRFPKPDFLSEPWIQAMWDTFDSIDATLYTLAVSSNIIPWTNSTAFVVGNIRIDTADGSAWLCAVAHTSATTPTTFASDRSAHSTFWSSIQLSLRPRGQWLQSTSYLIGDIVYDVTGGRNIFALCITTNISTGVGTILTDAAKWTFVFNGATFATANSVAYDHTVSLLVATNVQAAIDEVVVNTNNRLRFDAAQTLSSGQKTQGQTNLGLGSAAVLTAGTAANNAVQMTAAAKLPAVDGSLLTGVVAAGSAPTTRVISATGLLTGGGDLSADRAIFLGKSTQAQAIALTDDTTAMTPLRTADSIGTRITRTVSPGTSTITIPTGTTRAIVRMWGGTGGSGGVPAGGSSGTGGTGAGGYLESLLTGLVAGNTFSYTQGAAGTAGTSAPTNGGNGTATILASGTQVITTLTANASNGSLAAAGSGTPGTIGGTATNGDINITGQTGVQGVSAGMTSPGVMPGGRNFYSVGANGVFNSVATAGNAGSAGGIIIEWYP